LLELLARLNGDFRVHGILVQLPLPKHLDERRIVAAVDPAKDVDGFHPENIGLLSLGRPRFVPCTTLGILCLLEQAGLDVTGLEAMVAGRSNIVGKPTAMALTACHATVTVCHTRTRDLEAVVRRSALIVAAIGRPEAIRGDWIAPGAIVIDVGTNRVDERLVGDVQFAPAAERAAWITPVPGGVGPMTIAMLMRNTVSAATGERG
jgi:methylenetetrahydrofolate dehydrogenase (NADP+)/methenyltetrahydrofolate cyclohydrolase